MAVRGQQQDEPSAAANVVEGATKPSGQAAKEQEMLTRVMAALTALLSFAVVCFAGLLRGSSFGSVLTASLIAMAVGGVVGFVVTLVVRSVVAESFKQELAREREVSDAASPTPATASQGQTSSRTAGQQDRAEESAPAPAKAGGRTKK